MKKVISMDTYYNKLIKQLLKTHELEVEQFLDLNLKENDDKQYFINNLWRRLLIKYPEGDRKNPMQVIRAYHWKDKKFKERGKEARKNAMTIFEMWLGDWSELKHIIDVHLSEFMTADEDSQQIHWIRRDGDFKYMAGFYRTCVEKKWMNSGYTAHHLKEIFQNTFGIAIGNAKPFQPGSYNNLDDLYLEPWKVIPRRH